MGDRGFTGQHISIHAPRMRSDAHLGEQAILNKDFNPRSPHEERHPQQGNLCTGYGYFNPRSPHEERLSKAASEVPW